MSNAIFLMFCTVIKPYGQKYNEYIIFIILQLCRRESENVTL